jgi:ribulose-phosphate 3-epimerase
MVQIAPSLLAADFAWLGEALRLIEEAGAPMVHVDVMDGHFVPDISVGQPVVKGLRKATKLVLDLHLLIERPERYVPEFIEIGADRIAIHAEATPNLHRVLKVIRSGGAKAGLAVNPSTALASVAENLGEIDYLLILSADLGFENPAFLPKTLRKVRDACAMRRDGRMDFAIEVEGAVREDQIESLGEAGADILVAGSDIFQDDPKTRLVRMVRRAAALPQVSRV